MHSKEIHKRAWIQSWNQSKSTFPKEEHATVEINPEGGRLGMMGMEGKTRTRGDRPAPEGTNYRGRWVQAGTCWREPALSSPQLRPPPKEATRSAPSNLSVPEPPGSQVTGRLWLQHIWAGRAQDPVGLTSPLGVLLVVGHTSSSTALGGSWASGGQRGESATKTIPAEQGAKSGPPAVCNMRRMSSKVSSSFKSMGQEGRFTGPKSYTSWTRY